MRLKDKAKRRDSNWYRNIKMQIKNRELAEDFNEVFFVCIRSSWDSKKKQHLKSI